MQTIIRILVFVLAIGAAADVVCAADLRGSSKDTPAHLLPSAESTGVGIAAGPYFGLTVGAGIANHDIGADIDYGEGYSAGADVNGFGSADVLFGLIGGYEFAIGRVRLGPIAMYDFGEIESTASIHGGNDNAGISLALENFWHVGGTLGFTVGEHQEAEIFALGAWSGADWKLKGTGELAGELEHVDGLKTQDDLTGLTIGGGIKGQISGGLEAILLYTYTDFGKVDIYRDENVRVRDEVDVHMIKAGLMYKFGGQLPSLR